MNEIREKMKKKLYNILVFITEKGIFVHVQPSRVNW